MKYLLFIVLSCWIVSVNAQNFSDNWESHFSYLSVTAVSQSEETIYVATENVVFTYDIDTFELNEITTVEGLSGETISTIHYSIAYEMLIIGYENGLMEIYQDGAITSVVDILNKQTIPPNNKKINHFNEYNNVVYIATDYGISVYNLENLEFGDTYFIGNGGSQIGVNQTEIFEGQIYAACEQGSGMRIADVDNDNLIDYQQWTQLFTGGFYGVEAADTRLYTISLSSIIYEIVNGALVFRNTLPEEPVNFSSYNDRISITTTNRAYLYESNFQLVTLFTGHEDFPTKNSTSTAVGDYLYIGTLNQGNGKPGFGILRVDTVNDTEPVPIHPQGPLLNNVFSASIYNGQLWNSFGGFSNTYNFNGGERMTGLSHYNGEEWVNVKFDSIRADLAPIEPFYLSDVAINPFNPNQVYVSSYWSGVIEVTDHEGIIVYDETNSPIQALADVFCLTLNSEYDSEGALWSISGRVDSPLTKFQDGQWQSYDFSSVVTPPTSNLGYSDIVPMVQQETVFVGSLKYGVVGVHTGTGEVKAIFDQTIANLPATGVYSLALDRSNQLWIGTNKGLRVLYNTSNFFTSDTVGTEAIIILEDGLPKELLEQQFISDIKVDGSNNKWVATIGAGVFYFSSNAQETIYHFTRENSPLPSNNVKEVAVDDVGGAVYFATDRGLVAFNAGGSKPQDNLSDAFVYPNPVRPQFNMQLDKIKIKDISENVNIKITDIEGNLVAEAQSNTNLRHRGFNLEIDGGTAYWNGKNLANNTVATGVYLVMLSDLDSLETKVLKLMVVR